MQVLNAEQTLALLPYGALADELAKVLRRRRAGETVAPPRLPLQLPGGVLFLMPASDGELAIAKLVSVHAANAGSGLAVVQADVLLLEAATGRRLLLLDGAVVTARRTAALSLLAARLLAPNRSGPLLVIGAGVQARAHVEAFIGELGVAEVFVYSRDQVHAAALAAHARTLGATAETVTSPNDVLAQATIIVTATTSTTPVLPSAVRDDAFIAAVGAFRPDMAELPPDLLRRSRVYVDTLEGAQSEAGDLIQAAVDWTQVTPLEAALDAPRPQNGPILFKSVGHALWDLAAARLAYAIER